MSRIVVIGAGIGGMCTAARLAKAGHIVDVYESSDQVGGKCRTEWIGKYAFDTGPSLLTLPAVYRDFFLKTGEPIEKVLDLQPVNPSFDYRFADGTRVEFANLSRYETLATISKSFGKNVSDEWNSLMERAEKIWDVSREPFIESELTSIFSFIKRRTFLRDLFTIAPWKSLRTLVNSFTNDPHLSFIIDRYATYSGSDPRKAPAALMSIAFVEEAFGAWHIKGGIGQLSQAVEERAKSLGVKFHLNSPVVSIDHTKKHVTGITLSSGEIIKADVVVSNADASTVYTHLISKNVRALRKEKKSLAKSEASLGGFSLLLGLKPDDQAPHMNHHTVLFPENYDAEFDSIFTQQKPVEDPTIYICAPNDVSMSRTPGYESWFILVNAPRHSTTGDGWNWNDDNYSRAYAAKVISLIEARGIPLRNRIELMEIRTPADLEKSVGAPGGSIYGSSSNGARSAFMRAKNRSPLKGLFCVGGSAHPGGGLPLVGISAEIVADAIGRA